MNVKNNEKYSSAGHTFCWKKRIQLMQKAYIGFMKGGSFIIDIHDFISKRK